MDVGVRRSQFTANKAKRLLKLRSLNDVKSEESLPHALGDCLEQAHNPDSTASKLGNRTAPG